MPSSNKFRPIRNDIISSAEAKSTSRNLSFPIEDNDYGILLMFREYQYKTSAERGFARFEGEGTSSNVSDTIFLPLPANITDSFQVRVQRFDQGSTGDIVSDFASGIDVDNFGLGNLAGAVTSGALRNLPGAQGNSLNEVMGNLSQDLAFLARKGIDTAFPNQGRNIDAGTGTFVNPKAALSFEGVEMKVHNFDWSLSPKNEGESNRIRQISNTIKKNILPQYVNSSNIQRAMFKYPSLVDVFFIGIDSAHYFYFKTCMVQSFNTNFTPNGNAVMRGGRPAAVQMQITMIESDIHTAKDYGASSVNVDTTTSSRGPDDGFRGN